jgi:hypothetical protein
LKGKEMAETIVTKRCPKCKQIKSVSEFSKRCNRPIGYESHCKQCRKEYFKLYRRSDTGISVNRNYKQSENGKQSEKRYVQSEKGRKTKAKTIKNHKLRHPDRAKARKMVTNAIRDDKLFHPSKLICHFCLKKAEQYHHPNYNVPLFVFAVCKSCHLAIHRQSISL